MSLGLSYGFIFAVALLLKHNAGVEKEIIMRQRREQGCPTFWPLSLILPSSALWYLSNIDSSIPQRPSIHWPYVFLLSFANFSSFATTILSSTKIIIPLLILSKQSMIVFDRKKISNLVKSAVGLSVSEHVQRTWLKGNAGTSNSILPFAQVKNLESSLIPLLPSNTTYPICQEILLTLPSNISRTWANITIHQYALDHNSLLSSPFASIINPFYFLPSHQSHHFKMWIKYCLSSTQNCPFVFCFTQVKFPSKVLRMTHKDLTDLSSPHLSSLLLFPTTLTLYYSASLTCQTHSITGPLHLRSPDLGHPSARYLLVSLTYFIEISA